MSTAPMTRRKDGDNITESSVIQGADTLWLQWGRNGIRLAEQEDPGLMATREEYRGKTAVNGAKISGATLCNHCTNPYRCV